MGVNIVARILGIDNSESDDKPREIKLKDRVTKPWGVAPSESVEEARGEDESE